MSAISQPLVNGFQLHHLGDPPALLLPKPAGPSLPSMPAHFNERLPPSGASEWHGSDLWHVLPQQRRDLDQFLALLAGVGKSADRSSPQGNPSTASRPPGTNAEAGPANGLRERAAPEALADPPPPPAPPSPPAGPSGPTSGPTITLVADTDRDGLVSDGDLPGRAEYTGTRGAIYSVNFDDDNSNGIPDAVGFNDSGVPINENRTIENIADVQDLAPLVIKAFGPGFTPDMTVRLAVAELEDAQSIHIFPSLTPGAQSILGEIGTRVSGGIAAATSVDITSLISPTEDVTFGVEGMFFPNTNATIANTFDGQVDLSLQVFQGATLIGQDTVRMKVAPWLMLPHSQESLQIWAENAGSSNAGFLFNASASPGYYGLDDSGQLNTVSGSSAGTQWFQDHVEIGYTQRPGGPPTQVVFRLPYFRGTGVPQPSWPQSRLLGPNVGTFQLGVSLGAGAGDYGGNVELLPPTPAYPLGRIVHGDSGSNALFNFFTAQEAQPALRVPTRWLAVSHVDEIVGFTTTPTEVVVADPQDAYARMEAIPEAERGRAVFFATGRFPEAGIASSPGTTTRIFTGVDLRGQSWAYLRLYDSSASGSGAAGQVARIASGGLGDGYIDVQTVWNTTSKIVDPVGGASAMRWMLFANAPSRSTWYNIPQPGDRFVLVEGTRTWSGGTPAIVTTAEVLADTELRNLNLIDIQNTISTTRTTLDTAAGGLGTLSYLEVPVLYVGFRSGFTTNGDVSAFTPGLQNFQLLGDDYYVPSQYGPRVASGMRSGPISFTTDDEDESPFTFTVTGTVNAAPLTVTQLAATSTGFTARFNRPIDRSVLNLYDTATFGPADVALVGASTGPVTGSLAVDPSGTEATFVRTGGLLPDDSYTLTLRSAVDGFKDTLGAPLDGNTNGPQGDDYVFTFSVSPPAGVTVSVPDLMRGPGQPANVPAGGNGLPLRLSNGNGVTSVQLTLRYDPALLQINGAAVGSAVPAGATVSLNTSTPGRAVVSLRSPTPLPAGSIDFVTLSTLVPETAEYASQHLLDITNLSVNQGAIVAQDDDALHVVAYLGDVTGNGAYTSQDARLIQRRAVGLEAGFSPYSQTDPVIVADINGNGILNSTDANRVLQESVGMDRPEISPIPVINPPPPPAPEIQVLDGAGTVLNNSFVDLGDTPLGTPLTRTFTIRNVGAAPLTLGQISVPYGFVLVSSFGSMVLAPTAETSFTVRMLATGIDVLEAVANDLVPNVRFVDGWNLYHRLLGEIHCGSVVMRTPYSFRWWSLL